MRPRSWLVVSVATVAITLLVGRGVSAFMVEYAWYAAMGVPRLFWERVTDQLLLQGGAWVVGSLFALLNLQAVRRTILAVAVPARVANLELTAIIPAHRLRLGSVLLAMLLGAAIALPLTQWVDVAMVRHGLPFGELEGVTDRDLGFFVYWLPLEEGLYLWAMMSVVAVTAVVTILYALTRSLRMDGRRVVASTHVRRHLSVLGALVLAVLAWSYRLDGFDLMRQGSGPDGAFLRLDHQLTLRIDFLLTIGCAVAAVVVWRTGWVGQLRSAFVALSAVLGGALILRHVVPTAAAQSAWLGDPARRDQDYLTARALFSRRAFDVEQMRPEDPEAGRSVDRSAVRIPLTLWDQATLQRSLSPTRADVMPGADQRLSDATSLEGWRQSAGRLYALSAERSPGESERWMVRERDVSLDAPTLSRSTTRTVADRSVAAWFAAPGLAAPLRIDAGATPDAPAVSLQSWPSRVAHAWVMRDLALLTQEAKTGAPSRLVTHRDVRDRVGRLAPVFVQSEAVRAIQVGGAWYWVLYLYSASDHYPFSQRWSVAGGIFGYFKLAATAVVSAETGRVELLVAPNPDPIARSWFQLVPQLIVPPARIPLALAEQLPPPTEQVTVQLRTFARYGSRFDPRGPRHMPDSAWVGGDPALQLMQTPDGPRLSWSMPILDGTDRIEGVAVAVGGGRPATFWRPVPLPGAAWTALRAPLAGLPDSARARATGSVRDDSGLRTTRPLVSYGSRGLWLWQAITADDPREGEALLFLGATNGVRTALAPNLREVRRALGDSLAGGELGAAPPEDEAIIESAATAGDLTGTARRLYDTMRSALARGDWKRFGMAFDSLGELLRPPPP